MKILLILLSLLSFIPAHAQSDLELVKSFGRALESTPSLARGTVSNKKRKMDEIWYRSGGARDKLKDYIKKEPFTDTIIYNSMKYVSSFLMEAYDTNNTEWMKEIATVLSPLKNKLTESDLITFNYPVLPEGYFNRVEKTIHKNPNQQAISSFESLKKIREEEKEPKAIYLKAQRKFKLWLNPIDETNTRSENQISSSQFLYGISVIIHYTIKNKLENDEILGPFVEDYYDIVMNHHYLRWILNKGIPVGSFQVKGWRCNSGNFSHKQHVENLLHKRYGTEYFKNIGAGKNENRGFCNFYQDRDGYIAMGLAHLMAAHKINPSKIKIDNKNFNELHTYLQSSLDLFTSRSKIQNSKNENQEILVFDLGGLLGHENLKYSGYYDQQFPGWKDPRGKTDKNFRTPAIVKPPTPPKVSWDVGHAWRFVNYFWSSEKTIKDLNLNFDYEDLATAYANNLLYTTLKREASSKNYPNGKVYFTNFLCGNNGWYRVNYLDEPGKGIKPSELSKSVLTWGQAYFIKYNDKLYDPMSEMYEIHFKQNNKDAVTQNVAEELSTVASMPEDFFK